jgi:hypothetical protein
MDTYNKFGNLFLNHRFIFQNEAGDLVKAAKEAEEGEAESEDEKELDKLAGKGKVSNEEFDKWFKKETEKTKEEGKELTNKAKEKDVMEKDVIRLKEKLIVGNIVDKNGNVNSADYVMKIAEQKDMKIENRLLPSFKETDKYLSNKETPLDEFLGKGATARLIDQLATAYTKLIDAGNYEGLKTLCYDVSAYLSDFHAGYTSIYRESTEGYDKTIQAAANDLKNAIEKAAA